ncbi:MAG: hypothetical protein Q9180_007647 [Flavoplaca navasiana]
MNRQAIRSSLVQSTSTVRSPRLRQASRSGHSRALRIAPLTIKPKLVNVAVHSAFRGYRGYLLSESSQIINPSRFRTHTTQSDWQESKYGSDLGSAGGHNKESSSLTDSEADSGKSATITMTIGDFEAKVKEKVEGLRREEQERLGAIYTELLLMLCIFTSGYYIGKMKQKKRGSRDK